MNEDRLRVVYQKRNLDKLEIFKGHGLFSVPPMRDISALKHVTPQASHVTSKFFRHKKQENYH